ncbi:FAD-dependent oxidoreductase [Paenibacillus sp. JX-17]|uniref:FAD-dependent oxidoreductase n=1 Tax=Paenibacillus lacisoli TaxID=3064525 RepID=A0ABT9CFP1_9BACL|nr:FAD-dependent oxidoreductase [Paenibacillus sp. JX-17]MDO7906418.1 FAD-dependent oxidoreductase [Paenibacillus sp. JX-17]
MDLQNGKLYWPSTVNQVPGYPALEEDLECEVLIIGAGTAGAQCAAYLVQQGIKPVVVDKRRVSEGSTATNTALIQYAGEKSFVSLAHTFGEEAAVRHLKLCEAAINEIEASCWRIPGQAQFVRRESLYYASYDEDIRALDEEYAMLTKHGFKVERWDADRIALHYPFRKAGALYYYDDAEMNPVQYVYGLLELAAAGGARIYENTEITGRAFEEEHALFYTHERRQIRARHVIIAAGYEDLEFKGEKNAVISSSYAVVTSPVNDFSSWYQRALIWETARPYIYMRTTQDNRVIIGGLDKDTADERIRDKRTLHSKDRLIEEFNKLFPDIEVKADYYLGAFYGGTHDGLPMIGRYPQYPRCYTLMGYGDNGTVYNQVLARLVCDDILGKNCADMELYLQNRPLLNR